MLALCQHHQRSIYLAPAIEVRGAGEEGPGAGAGKEWPNGFGQQKQQQVISSALGTTQHLPCAWSFIYFGFIID